MTMTNPNTKKAAPDKGKYLTVFKKQSDGTWKAMEDMVSSDGPMTPAK
jgi:ketosteroid isomerase-like protein